jgi:hypothetical protein
MRKVCLFLTVLLLAGCAKQYRVENLSGTRNTVTLMGTKSVYIAAPEDGRYESTTYPGSGQTVAQVLAGAFSKFASKVNTADTPATMPNDFSAAKNAGASYIVLPIITHWEQRATAWSGMPSKMAVRITIYDVNSGKELTTTSIEGRSAIMTMFPTSPDALLRDPAEKYVSSLYR